MRSCDAAVDSFVVLRLVEVDVELERTRRLVTAPVALERVTPAVEAEMHLEQRVVRKRNSTRIARVLRRRRTCFLGVSVDGFSHASVRFRCC